MTLDSLCPSVQYQCITEFRFLFQKEIEQAHGEVYEAKAEWANITSTLPTAEQLLSLAEPPVLEITLPEGATLPEGIIVPEGIILTSSTEGQILITLPMDATSPVPTGEQTMVTLLSDASVASHTGDQAFINLPVDAALSNHTEGQVFLTLHGQMEDNTVFQLVPGSA